MDSIAQPTVDLNNQTKLEALAGNAVANARRRLKLSDVDWYMHREDMLQTALVTLYEFPGQPERYVFGVLRNRLTDYALVHIYGRQTGKNAKYARGCYVKNVEDPELNMDTYLARFYPRNHISRPVEQQVLAQEAEPEQQRFWERVEHGILNILVATGGSKCRADRLQRYAQIVVGRLQGMTNAAVALALSLTVEEVVAILERARLRLQAFLDESSLMQGLILAEGALRVFWADEISPALLNGGRKFVAVLPHGTYHVRYHAGKAYVQMAQKAGGRVCTRMVILDRVGALTVERLLEGTRELQAKLDALDAA